MFWRLIQHGRTVAVAVCWSALTATGLAGEPRLNQIQVIGSHNSYHIAPDHGVMSLIAAAGAPGRVA